MNRVVGYLVNQVRLFLHCVFLLISICDKFGLSLLFDHSNSNSQIIGGNLFSDTPNRQQG